MTSAPIQPPTPLLGTDGKPLAAAKPPAKKRNRILTHLRSSMFSGLITLVPLFITVYLLWVLTNFLTVFSGPIAKWIVPTTVRMFRSAPENDPLIANITAWTSPILALLITAVVVYVLGVLSIFAVGRRILAQFEHLIENLPLVKGIYGTTKQVVTVFRQGGDGHGFQRVILVQFPRLGTWTVAFVTNTITDSATGEQLLCCFIPMTPNPTSGFFQMFPASDVRNTDWTVDLGIKIILSGGLLAPPQLDAPHPPATENQPLASTPS